MMKRTSFFLSFFGVLEGFIGLHWTINFSFFNISVWGIDLDYCDIECFALETNRDNSVVFEIAPKYCISDFFVDYVGCFISFKGILATVVDIMVIWIKFAHSILVHWFLKCWCSLAINCLITSDLPWFMDLTFQVPLKYFSLQNWTLLSSPVTSTTGGVFVLALSLHSFWCYFSTLLQ